MSVFKKLTFFFLSSLFFFQCNSDDSSPSSGLTGVPTGEIVPLVERDEVLTGDPNGLGGRIEAGPVIWWLNAESKILTCDGSESDDITDGYEYSFGTDGIVYARIVGLPSSQTAGETWSWASSAKDAIIYQGVTFNFTELNSNAVTYGSKQSFQGQCAITYQRFTK